MRNNVTEPKMIVRVCNNKMVTEQRERECAMNTWITNEKAEEQATLYPSLEITSDLCTPPVHAESHMRFVHLTAFPLDILNRFRGES